jgi:AcrR family transcriptional regulator
MPAKKLAPQQARSRESLKRLLTAAAEILDERGLDGATIPRIAARASLTPGAVYRRFRNKDALLRTLFLEVLRGAAKGAEGVLNAELLKQPLCAIAEQIVETSLRSHRQHGGLLRAMRQFWQSHPSAAFRRQMDELEVINLQRVAAAVLTKRARIGHPDPDKAVPFGLLLVGFTLREVIDLGGLSATWSEVMPHDDRHLVDELTRAFLSYLGCHQGE